MADDGNLSPLSLLSLYGPFLFTVPSFLPLLSPSPLLCLLPSFIPSSLHLFAKRQPIVLWIWKGKWKRKFERQGEEWKSPRKMLVQIRGENTDRRLCKVIKGIK